MCRYGGVRGTGHDPNRLMCFLLSREGCFGRRSIRACIFSPTLALHTCNAIGPSIVVSCVGIVSLPHDEENTMSRSVSHILVSCTGLFGCQSMPCVVPRHASRRRYTLVLLAPFFSFLFLTTEIPAISSRPSQQWTVLENPPQDLTVSQTRSPASNFEIARTESWTHWPASRSAFPHQPADTTTRGVNSGSEPNSKLGKFGLAKTSSTQKSRSSHTSSPYPHLYAHHAQSRTQT